MAASLGSHRAPSASVSKPCALQTYVRAEPILSSSLCAGRPPEKAEQRRMERVFRIKVCLTPASTLVSSRSCASPLLPLL
eukprot:scaffold10723_cov113-Isochrysis_galbana.AAC.4